MDPSQLFQAALDGDRAALARLLRVVEDRRPGWQETIAAAWRRARRAHIVGVTGAPGSGKSTLVSALVTGWRAVDRQVAVVAVDPSSPFTGGALLGDRIRMQDHAGDGGVFIRSMSNRGRLGGVADATAALVTLFDAVRYDPIVVETVGVGQAEVDIVDQADTVAVVLAPGWGDGVQADKAGVAEIADILVVNKADQPGAADTRRWLTTSLEMGPERDWVPPVVETVASVGTGVESLLDAIDRHHRHLMAGEGTARRRRRARAYVERAALDTISRRLDHPDLGAIVDEVVAGAVDPWAAARRLVGG